MASLYLSASIQMIIKAPIMSLSVCVQRIRYRSSYEIWRFHGGEYSNCDFFVYDAV
jgi:hypothetical protein